MYAKQYEITLPADYDMHVIRDRVARGGHLLDERAGLGLKAYSSANAASTAPPSTSTRRSTCGTTPPP